MDFAVAADAAHGRQRAGPVQAVPQRHRAWRLRKSDGGQKVAGVRPLCSACQHALVTLCRDVKIKSQQLGTRSASTELIWSCCTTSLSRQKGSQAGSQAAGTGLCRFGCLSKHHFQILHALLLHWLKRCAQEAGGEFNFPRNHHQPQLPAAVHLPAAAVGLRADVLLAQHRPARAPRSPRPPRQSRKPMRHAAPPAHVTALNSSERATCKVVCPYCLLAPPRACA